MYGHSNPCDEVKFLEQCSSHSDITSTDVAGPLYTSVVTTKGLSLFCDIANSVKRGTFSNYIFGVVLIIVPTPGGN